MMICVPGVMPPKVAGVVPCDVVPLSRKIFAPLGLELIEIAPVIRVRVANTGVVVPAITVTEFVQS